MPEKVKVHEKKQKWYGQRDINVMLGSPLNYNYSIQLKYYKKIKPLLERMFKETEKQISYLFESDISDKFFNEQYAQDASIASQAKIVTNKLISKFGWLFNDKARQISESMMNATMNVSKSNLKDSIKQLSGGLSIKTGFLTGDLREITKSIVEENVSLIKSISDRYLYNVQKAVLRSISFGNGLKDLIPQLSKFKGITDRHAKNMALDQTRKAYNSINRARMEKVGIGKFKWIHSGGGQLPRKDHIEMSGNIYSFDDLPVIDKRTGERGIPGQAINCRCLMVPVIEFSE
jgi:SPP1 gp7 family putative phage head morphogenesis protein